MVPMYGGYDYVAFMDYMDLEIHCLRKTDDQISL